MYGPDSLNQWTGVLKNQSESSSTSIMCVRAAMILASLCISGRYVEMK